ncbi:hypothetical protein ASJ36_20670 [Aeromonas sp. ARM81]|nr:hypothetical protein ASJ36_20670 [Aeromonas sp. ARM81]
MFCLATNEIAQTGLSSLPPVIYYSEQLFRRSQRRQVSGEHPKNDAIRSLQPEPLCLPTGQSLI